MLVTSIFSFFPTMFSNAFSFKTWNDRVENIVGKGEKADFLEIPVFSAFPTMSLNALSFKTWNDRVENIVGKGENAGFQHFLLL